MQVTVLQLWLQCVTFINLKFLTNLLVKGPIYKILRYIFNLGTLYLSLVNIKFTSNFMNQFIKKQLEQKD